MNASGPYWWYKSTLAQVLAWCRQAINRPLPEPMLTQIYVAKWRHYIGLNDVDN